jgi:hypothetical protein
MSQSHGRLVYRSCDTIGVIIAITERPISPRRHEDHEEALYQPALTLNLLMSSASGSTRGSAGSGIVFGVESSGVAAHDVRVEPEHDVITHVSSSSPRGITMKYMVFRLRDLRVFVVKNISY